MAITGGDPIKAKAMETGSSKDWYRAAHSWMGRLVAEARRARNAQKK